jgi:hypothetical protein
LKVPLVDVHSQYASIRVKLPPLASYHQHVVRALNREAVRWSLAERMATVLA